MPSRLPHVQCVNCGADHQANSPSCSKRVERWWNSAPAQTNWFEAPRLSYPSRQGAFSRALDLKSARYGATATDRMPRPHGQTPEPHPRLKVLLTYLTPPHPHNLFARVRHRLSFPPFVLSNLFSSGFLSGLLFGTVFGLVWLCVWWRGF